MLLSDGFVMLIGLNVSEMVINNGIIVGLVVLFGGDDCFVNVGIFGGVVVFGDGDDEFV